MKIDLSAPVELWDTVLPTREYPACALKLYNLTDMLMVSVEVTLLLLDEKGEEQSRVLYRAHDLHGEPGKTFRMAVPVQPSALPQNCEVVFEKVWYENGTVWRRTRNSTLSFVSNVLPKGRELDMLRLTAGETAVGFPDEQQNGWLCVCGRPNPYELDACVRCHRRRGEIMQRFSRETVEQYVADQQAQLDAKARQALEEAARRREKNALMTSRRRKKRIAAISAAAVLVVGGVLAYGTVFHLKPYLRYRDAEAAFAAGRYAEAQTAFDAMAGYRDADDYVLRCRYEQARALLGRKDAALLAQAETALAELGEYQDAAGLVLEARRQRADVLLGAGDVVSARALYKLLGDQAQLTECDYLLACDMQQNGDYAAAMQAFAALDNYKGAHERWSTSLLSHAAAMLTAGQKPDDVLSLLSALPEDHAGAVSLRKQAWYGKGKVLQAAGDSSEAAECYVQAGDYQDAAALAVACVYGPACEAQEAGDLMKAAQLFGTISGYSDADERRYACITALAESALDDMEYKLAASLLALLPEEDEQANALRSECLYRPAAAAMAKKDYAAAIEGFAQLGDYSDSAKQLAKARYAYAGQLASTDPDAALALYEALGDYSDSAKKLRTLRYSTAVAAQAAGEMDRAESLLVLLGDYRDSEKRVQQIRYARAEALLADGMTDEAIAAFTALGAYSNSAARVQQIRYSQAEALIETSPADAIAAFAELGEYSDAADRADQLRYAAAEALIETSPADAIAAFAALGEYSDAADRADQLRYAAAEALIETSAADAITAFAELGEYSDAADRADQLRYAAAEALVAAGSIDDAITAFAALGEYSDASSRAQQLRYSQAELLQTGGDLEHALSLFVQLGEYSDSADHVLVIRYQMAKDLAANGDFDGAAAAYAALGEYSDAASQINAVRYMQAEAQLAEGNADAAISTFAALGEYADSADRILGVRYDAAAMLAAEGSYAEAEAAYAALGEYSDSADRVLKMRYCQAEMTLSTGAWESAKAAFQALGEYSDAADRMLDCDLLHANQLLTAGDEAAAEALYLAVGNYGDAAESLKALYYTQAKRLEDAGDRGGAAALYLQAGEYSDAAARAAECLKVFSQPYAEALAAMEQGDAAKALTVLGAVNLTNVPAAFQGMLTLYAEAAQQQCDVLMDADPAAAAALLEQLPANVAVLVSDYASRHDAACVAALRQAMADGSDDEAVPFVLRVRSEEVLMLLEGRAELLLLGAWTDGGHTCVFMPEGRCLLDGEALCYALDGYNILTGETSDLLTVTHKVAVMPDLQLQLRDVRNGGNQRMTLQWRVPEELPPIGSGD